jgi:hypothetical protein
VSKTKILNRQAGAKLGNTEDTLVLLFMSLTLAYMLLAPTPCIPAGEFGKQFKVMLEPKLGK